MTDEESRLERKVQVMKIMDKTYWKKDHCSQEVDNVTLNYISSYSKDQTSSYTKCLPYEKQQSNE